MIAFLRGVPGKLKTITDYLTTHMSSGRMALLDAAISTRAPAAGALSDAVWTGTKAGYLDAAMSSRLGSIKAIYRGTVVISAGSYTTGTATITAVNTAKAVCFETGQTTTDANGILSIRAYITLTNSTTITATRAASGASLGSTTVGYTVVEFN